jgi:hypothetical protein
MRLVDEIKQELHPKLLLSSITVGTLAGVTDLGMEISLAPISSPETSAQTMRKQDPEVAALLHEWIARFLAERLAANNHTIEALMD